MTPNPPDTRKGSAAVMYEDAVKQAEMLDRIFDMTYSIYSQMCTTDNNAKDNHSEIFRLITELGSVIV